MVQTNYLKKPKIIIIGGATGVGKSEVAIKLAKEFNGEIISADSMQIYKNFNIGTAKLLTNQQQGIRHHLIDIKDGSNRYSVAEFKIDAEKAINQIIRNNKIPIIVGGTGLYLNSLLFNYEFSGKGETRRSTSKYSFCPIVLEVERVSMYKNIEKRVDSMIKAGLLEEIKTLLQQGFTFESMPFRAIGYKEFGPYFLENTPLDLCIKKLKQNTRNYAKRQVTWFKQWQGVALYCSPNQYSEIEEKVKEFINEN